MDGCIDFTFCELREREVINIADGKRLGRVIDMALPVRAEWWASLCPGKENCLRISADVKIYLFHGKM